MEWKLWAMQIARKKEKNEMMPKAPGFPKWSNIHELTGTNVA